MADDAERHAQPHAVEEPPAASAADPESVRDAAIPTSASVTVNIKSLNGPDFELVVERDVLISELKTKVRERTDVAESRQRLIYRGKVLMDEDPLSTYKIEDGHFVHMVARPPGVPLPSAATGGISSSSAVSDVPTNGATAGVNRPGPRGRRTLGERLLLGMGMPAFAQAEGGRAPSHVAEGATAASGEAGSGGSGSDADNAMLNAAAGLENDFLSNMLGLANAENARAPPGPRSMWSTAEGRGSRGQRRDSVTTAAASNGSGGRSAEGVSGDNDLEHVRQGLLTLHTLLSSTSNVRSVNEQRAHVPGSGHQNPHQDPHDLTHGVSGADPMAMQHEVSATRGGTAEAAPAHNCRTIDRTEAEGEVEEAARSRYLPLVSARGASPTRSGLPPALDDSSDDGDGEESMHERGEVEELDQNTGEPIRPDSRAGQVLLASEAQRSGSGASDAPPELLSSSGESRNEYESADWGQDRSEGRAAVSLSPGRSQLHHREVADDTDVGVEEEKGENTETDVANRRRATRKFFVGQWLDVKDTVSNWLEATVMDIADSGTKLQIHYNGWPPRWDEWLSWDSPRIAPFRTRTQHLPHSHHVSPAPISAVRNAPITGRDDVRVVVPEVRRVFQAISPMVDELSSCFARNLEQDPSTSPTGDRTVSHTLPWTRRRYREPQNISASASGAAAETDPSCAEAVSLAGDIAPLFDRLGRMLTDVAPHLARLANRADEEYTDGSGNGAAEPGEAPWGQLVPRRLGGVQRDDARRRTSTSRASERSLATGARPTSIADDTDATFRQLIYTSPPAPTSSNINIHIHAIVPLRAPPSPPPPPPPPPTASASAVATPTRADRPPLAVAGSRNPPWGGHMGTVGGSASLEAAARAAEASRAATSATAMDHATNGTTHRNTASVSGGHRNDADRDAGGTAGVSSNGNGLPFGRSSSLGSSVSFDVTGITASPLTVSSPGSSATLRSELGTTPPSSGSTGALATDASGGSEVGPVREDTSPGQGNAGPRRSGGWRGFLRALGVGVNGGSRVGGRRDEGEGD